MNLYKESSFFFFFPYSFFCISLRNLLWECRKIFSKCFHFIFQKQFLLMGGCLEFIDSAIVAHRVETESRQSAYSS